MATLLEIESLTKAYASLTKAYALTRKLLYDRMQELEEELAQVKKQHLMGIKKAVAAAASWQSKLNNAIEESPELFVKPRTVVLYGIKVGIMKGKGELRIENPEHTIKLLKKCMPEEDWGNYIKITESLIKTTLSQLPASELKRLGIEVIDTGDQVLIRPTDSEVDKLVEALLRDELKEMEAA